LTLKNEPGVLLSGGVLEGKAEFTVWVTGGQGVRFLSTLIEEATALRDELRAVVG
jgi:UDP-N-acetylglucosamine:LPS N-acetylglucosamine transferase